MEHVAIDLGGRESQICIRTANGEILEQRRCATERLGGYLKKRPKSRVILETRAEAFCIADAARALGHEVVVVPGTLVKSLGVGCREVKTDQRDAQKLSEVSCRIELPGVGPVTAVRFTSALDEVSRFGDALSSAILSGLDAGRALELLAGASYGVDPTGYLCP